MRYSKQIIPAVLALLAFCLFANPVFASGDAEISHAHCGDSLNAKWVIIDMIGANDLQAIDVNLDLLGCGKTDTGASSEGFGTNAINISDWHVMSRAGSGTDIL